MPLRTCRHLILFMSCFFIQNQVQAFTNRSFYAGLAYQAENALNKITTSDSGSKNTMGTTSYPLLLQYDYLVGQEYFLAPKLSYTLLARSASGSTGKVTQWHLMLPVGKNFKNSAWSWSAGLGILNNKFEGSGGIKTMSNGNTTADFAAPGQTQDSTRISFNMGTSYQISKHNIGFDLLTTGTLSDKRTFNLMLSYLYQFSGQSTGIKK